MLLFTIIEDFLFHITHRMFHINWKWLPLYSTFHKLHHEFNHTITISYAYATPLEYALSNWFPSVLGVLLLGQNCHFITIIFWMNLRLAETLEGHSGYEFPIPASVLLGNFHKLNPFFTTTSPYHDYHHSMNVGNYSSFFTIWDTVFNSNADYYAHLKEQE